MKRTKQNRSRNSSRGFTLIELLVVVAIISILAAFIFPAVTASRQKAHSIKCMGQLRQWGQAFNSYLSENNGIYPTGGSAGAVSINDTRAWYNAVARYAGEIPLNERLANNMPRPGDKSIFSCPSASLSELPGATVFLSYVINNRVYDAARVSGNLGVPELRYSHLSKPSTFPLLFDAAVNKGSGSSGDVKLRHRKSTGNILFADGRVENVTNSVSYKNIPINWDPEAAM